MTGSRLIHVGTAVVDYVHRIPALPAAGDEATATAFDRLPGGGFNLMAAAVRAGLPTAFAGRIGTGPHGDMLRAALKAEGIAVLTRPDPDGDTGHCIVLVADDGERTFISWPGAERRPDFAGLEDMTAGPEDWVASTGYMLGDPVAREAILGWLDAGAAGRPFVFDPTPVIADLADNDLDLILRRATWVSCNRDEAAVLARGDGSDAGRAVLARCPAAEGVVVRGGAEGCDVFLADGASHRVPGLAVAAVDTTGAGDVHIGCFIAALCRRTGPVEAARYANAGAAISVTRPGGGDAPTDRQIRDFLAARQS